jgi:cellulose biosynthesis protein BcsQ
MAKPPGRIATFYSYKGGTGRSMALANFAWILAGSGKHVLVIDWDLEAPGLHRYFRPFLSDPELFETDGLIDTFWTLASMLVRRESPSPGITDASLVIESFDDGIRRLNWKFHTDGYIDLIGAGRQGPTYSERVNTFDWKQFYEIGGANVLSIAQDHFRKNYDWILIDSRTGVSDTSGICTIQMPDTVVACLTLNRQSIDGVTAVLRSIKGYRSSTLDGSKIRTFPLATRIENAEQVRLEVARGYARQTLSDFLPKDFKLNMREYWDGMEIAYRPSYAFEEVLAPFGDATGAAGASDTMLAQMETVARRISGDTKLTVPQILEVDRQQVLEKYALGKREAPATPASKPAESATSADTEFLRGLLAKEQLWRSANFKWQLLLSRREVDLLKDPDKAGFGRNMSYYLAQSERMQEMLRRTEFRGVMCYVVSLLIGTAMFFMVDVARYAERAPITITWAQAIGYFEPIVVLGIVGYYSFFAWLVAVLVTTGITRPYKPYGVGMLTLMVFVMLGPFRREIRDYEPKP